MQIDQMGSRMYCILLDNEQETTVSEWAHLSHIDNENVIEDWLTEVIEKHKLIDPKDKNDTEHGTEILSTEGNDDG